VADAPVLPEPTPPPRPALTIFIGPNGLRAGWSLSIYIVIIALLATALHFGVPAVQHHLHPNAVQTPDTTPTVAVPESIRHMAPQEISVLLVVLFATWIMSRIEKRKFGQYGLGGNSRRWPQFLQGFFWGFAALSILIAALYLAHDIAFDGRLLHSFAIFKYAVAWLAFFFFVGIFEEFFFRGYIQFTLARGIGFGAVGFFISAFLWNFLFGFSHGSNPGESPIGLFSAGAIGVILCLSLWYTRSLWWAIGFHATWDWAESYFYGTADSGLLVKGHLLGTHPQGTILASGGATGPEGSWFIIPILALITLIIWATLRHERSKSTNQALVNPLPDSQLAAD